MTSGHHLGKTSALTLMACAGLAFAVESSETPNWMSPSIGPFTPSAHVQMAVGDSSGDPEALAAGHHDPTREDGTVQAIELGLSLRYEMLKGFATYAIGYGAEEEWDEEWEEAFLGLDDLPGGFELRGGRALARWGYRNARHLHAWDHVDMPLAYGRFLGDDGLISDGGDVTWLSKGVGTTWGLVLGIGEAREHDDHAHGEEEGHDDDHGDEDHDEDEDHEDEHGDEDHDEDEDHEDEHGHEEEAPLFADDLIHGRAFAQHELHDRFSVEGGVSVVVGDDEEGRELVVMGGDFTTHWRPEDGPLSDRPVRWTTELLVRDVETADDEIGFYSEAIIGASPSVDVGARVDYVEGSDAVGTEERLRLSPVATVFLDDERRVALRAQYNYDELDAGEEHSIWFQLGVNWGGSEVR